MLNEEGIKALLPPPRGTTTIPAVATEEPVIETDAPVTLSPGLVPATNPPAGPGDRLLFDPADTANYEAGMPQTLADTGYVSEQLPEPTAMELPTTTPPPRRSWTLIFSIAIALIVLAVLAFFFMKRRNASTTTYSNSNIEL